MENFELELLDLIKESGENGINGKQASEITEKASIVVWNTYKKLNEKGLVFCRRVGNAMTMFDAQYHTENDEDIKEPKMENNDFGKQLQNSVIEAIAQCSADKVVENVMPIIRKKCIKEFGMTPILHRIEVAKQPPVEVKAELPPCFNRILNYAVNKNPVMMTGPAGTGKGFLARTVALATQSKFYEVNAVKNSYDLTGFVDANSKFVHTPFYDACKDVSEGRKAVFLFDEMDCSDPEVLKIFNEALSSKEFTFPNNEHLVFDELIILCACNTFGTGSDEQYCGQQLDASTLDRFAVIKVDYNRKVEMNITRGDEQLVDFIDAFRRQTEKCGILFVASYRSLVRIVSMRGSSIPLKEIMRDCFIKSMGDDDLRQVLDNMDSSFESNPYYMACQGKNAKFPEVDEEFGLSA